MFWLWSSCSWFLRYNPELPASVALLVRNSWKSWLAASKKVVMYQRHQIGRTAANDGVAAKPPQEVFALAGDFVPQDGATAGVDGQAPRGAEIESALQPPEKNIDWASLVVGAARWLAENGVSAIKSAGAPTVLMFLCLLLVMMQQRDVRRLSGQVEELVNAVGEMRSSEERNREP